MRSVAFIGYGEFADAFARGLGEYDIELRAFVRPRADGAAADARRMRMRAAGVCACESVGAAVRGADVVLAAVPAGSAADVVEACVPHLRRGQMYVDPSSSPPAAKRDAAELVERAGSDYVDVAVLGTVVTAGARVPMLAAGRGAARWRSWASAAGLNVTVVEGPPGSAALVKLLRSVFMKGRDALVLEMLLAARRYGVLDAVIDSIGGAGEQVAFPSLVERIMCSLAVHAERRADELVDTASLLREVDVDPLMTEAGESRLRQLAESGLREQFGGQRPSDLTAVLRSLEGLEAV